MLVKSEMRKPSMINLFQSDIRPTFNFAFNPEYGCKMNGNMVLFSLWYFPYNSIYLLFQSFISSQMPLLCFLLSSSPSESFLNLSVFPPPLPFPLSVLLRVSLRPQPPNGIGHSPPPPPYNNTAYPTPNSLQPFIKPAVIWQAVKPMVDTSAVLGAKVLLALVSRFLLFFAFLPFFLVTKSSLFL